MMSVATLLLKTLSSIKFFKQFFAENLCREATERGHESEVLDLKSYDPEDTLVTEVIFFFTSWTFAFGLKDEV